MTSLLRPVNKKKPALESKQAFFLEVIFFPVPDMSLQVHMYSAGFCLPMRRRCALLVASIWHLCRILLERLPVVCYMGGPSYLL